MRITAEDREKCHTCGRPLRRRTGLYCSGECRQEYNAFHAIYPEPETEPESAEAMQEAA